MRLVFEFVAIFIFILLVAFATWQLMDLLLPHV